jgi:ribonuclease HI
MQQVNRKEQRTLIIYTESKITLNSIRSAKNQNHFVAEIRNRAVTLNKKKCKIEFKLEKAHAGIYANKIAGRLAKKETQNYYITYSKILKSAVKRIPGKKLLENGSQWEEKRKGAITNDFFPNAAKRFQ